MELRPSLQIKTVIKAMTDVVLPALDPANKLAQEQARLCIGTLQIVLSRLPLGFAYDRDELGRSLELARGLIEAAAGQPVAADALTALAQATAQGADVLDRARAEPSELEAANVDLRDKIGALIPTLYANAEIADLKTVSTLITENAREQLVRDRSWLIGQGWEPDPKALPAVETLIGK